MSGPIVRKYGFPNFDKIFGERELQHGVDESEDNPGPGDSQPETAPPASEAKGTKSPRPAKAAPKSKKKS